MSYNFTKHFFLSRGENGTTLVEVMFAIVIFMVIMIGGLNYFTLPQSIIAREKVKRLAISAAHHRMETLLALEYTEITADSNETDISVTLGKISGTRNTTVTEVDDSTDGLGGSDADGDVVDYKTITVEISWGNGNNKKVSIATKISEFKN